MASTQPGCHPKPGTLSNDFAQENLGILLTVLILREEISRKNSCKTDHDLTTQAVIVVDGGDLVSHQTEPTWLPSRLHIVDESKPPRLI